MTTSESILVSAENVTRVFHGGGGAVKALDDVSFNLVEGKTFALVGESGSGKTTAARIVLGLDNPNSGKIIVLGKDLGAIKSSELRKLRQSIQVVQQNPYSQLNRRHSVQRIIETPLMAFDVGDKNSRKKTVVELLEAVGLSSGYLERRPHELSGGQCQRVAIARALALNPKIVVLDEAVSALDVSVRAQVLNLLRSLQRERNLTYLFITHDLGVAHYLADEIAVMFQGKIVEKGNRQDIFINYRHYYTENLISSVPLAEPGNKKKMDDQIEALRTPNPNDACTFKTRCRVGADRDECTSKVLQLSSDSKSHEWRCHFPLERVN
jgi:oligopeptide transport system ATP-binding protein